MWRELRKIPAGETRSYAQIAAAIGQPKAVRAVGTANGDNHVAVLIPCHRVIRSDGTLGGYAGGHRAEEEIARCGRHPIRSRQSCRWSVLTPNTPVLRRLNSAPGGERRAKGRGRKRV